MLGFLLVLDHVDPVWALAKGSDKLGPLSV